MGAREVTENEEAFSDHLKRLRADRHLSLRQVEIRTDGAVSNGYLSQMENGQVKSPSVIMIHRLSVAYGVDFDDLCRRAFDHGHTSGADMHHMRTGAAVTENDKLSKSQTAGAFTPGPWVQDEACICSLDGTPVAQTCRKDEFWTTSDDDMPASEVERIAANASLIEAAPDLLEACQAFLTAFDTGKPAEAIMGAQIMARAAIAKATGTAAGAAT